MNMLKINIIVRGVNMTIDIDNLGNISVSVSNDIEKIKKGIQALKHQISIDDNNYDKKIHKYALSCYQDKYRELKVIELREKLKEEEKLFDNAIDIDSKELHYENINVLKIKIAKLNPNNKIDDDDLIKAPFEYVWSDEESLRI